MDVIEMSYWKVTANYDDGTYIERFYISDISYADIEYEIAHIFARLFGCCLDWNIELISGALSRVPVTSIVYV